MKTRVYLLALVVSCISTRAQITVDHVYPGTASSLYMVNLEVDGMKYVHKSDIPNNRFIKLYNLNHSLWKTINCNQFPTTTIGGPSPSTQYNYDAICISQHVFDCNDSIEFMYCSNSGFVWFTAIYNEAGTALLVADSMMPWCKLNIPNQFKPLYNTPNGAKLILSHKLGHSVVYNLPCAISPTLDIDKVMSGPAAILEVFPNPSYYETSVRYALPADATTGEIEISDIQGRIVARYIVDHTFSELLLDRGQLAPGAYVYSLFSDGKPLVIKKAIHLH